MMWASLLFEHHLGITLLTGDAKMNGWWGLLLMIGAALVAMALLVYVGVQSMPGI